MKLLARLTRSIGDSSDDLGSFSDLMSALMMVFLLVTVALLARTQKIAAENADIHEQLVQVEAERAEYKRVYDAFESIETTRAYLADLIMAHISPSDLERWSAEFDAQNLSIRFNDPETLFSPGSARISQTFEMILAEFAPMLLDALALDNNFANITSIRIEGHTSSEWSTTSQRLTPTESHIRNMALSQARAFSVVEHLSKMPTIEIHWNTWTKERIQALGIGPNRLVYDNDGEEDPERSRRVEVWVVPLEIVHHADVD